MSGLLTDQVLEMQQAYFPPSEGKKPPEITPAGMWAVMSAMLANADAISKNESDGLLPLGEAENQLNLNYANYWVGVLKGDETLMQGAIDIGTTKGVKAPHAGDENYMTAQISKYTTQFNADSTLSAQSNSFYGGLTSALQQSASDTAQTVALNIQMYQQGPLSQLQNIARGF